MTQNRFLRKKEDKSDKLLKELLSVRRASDNQQLMFQLTPQILREKLLIRDMKIRLRRKSNVFVSTDTADTENLNVQEHVIKDGLDLDVTLLLNPLKQ